MAGMDSLSSEERLLLGDVDGGQLFDITAVRPEARILVASARPRYRGEAWIELTQSPAGFEHEAEILCRPISGILDELTVEASRPLPADARWIIVGSGEEPVVEPLGTVSATMPAGNQSASRRCRLAIKVRQRRSTASACLQVLKSRFDFGFHGATNSRTRLQSTA
jgi:hypothetical protein